MNSTKKIAYRVFGTSSALLSVQLTLGIAYAEVNQSGGGEGLNLNQIKDILCTVGNWIFTFAMVFGIIFVLVAAFKYITSQGNAETISSATSTIFYAAIGIVIAIFAKGFPLIIASILKATGSSVEACP
ncbi:MAG: hypothetical protein V1489_02900 [Candidatus Liptonbacteria bacterium]